MRVGWAMSVHAHRVGKEHYHLYHQKGVKTGRKTTSLLIGSFLETNRQAMCST